MSPRTPLASSLNPAGPRSPSGASHRHQVPPMLTVQEVADLYLRTTRKGVYALVERGQLPGVVRIGRRVLICRDQLLEFLAESSVPSPREF